MKKLILLFVLLLAPSVFAQQFLWSTARVENVRHVDITNVISEVLEFYDLHSYYYDFTGFSKDRFVEMLSGYGFDDMELLNEIKEPTVFAMRTNAGSGSIIFVMHISQNNVNMLIFANNIQLELGSGIQSTGSYNRERFTRWFRTLLN